jgi:glycosyltransferase involved in cell wall biosynthesis
MDVSVVIPAFNEEESVKELYNKIKQSFSDLNLDFEIIFVNDGSADKTLKNLLDLKKDDQRLKVIDFRRNFGKADALQAGFSESKGEIIITMDSDLQDDPEEIKKFLSKIRDGYDLVVGWKHPRKDPISKRFPSKIFNFLVRSLTGINLHDSDNNFRAMRKEVVKDLHIYGGLFRYIPSIAHAKGYKITEIKVVHHKRKYGKSKWGLSRLFHGFFDLITIKFLLSYKSSPLRLFGFSGLSSFFLGFLIALYLLYLKYGLGLLIGNRPLLLLSILLIVIGIQFIFFGLLAEMLINLNGKSEQHYRIKKIY